ncbi:MAG: LITAF-like zinc ribbon domain-containing protein [Promethearchaeia archaeon]
MGDKPEKYAFCPFCKREVVPIKKPMDPLAKTIWAIIIIASLGIFVIPLIIYVKFIKKRKYCPKCETEVKFSDTPFDTPQLRNKQTTTEKKEEKKEEKEKEKKEEEEKIYCPFCGNELDKDVVTCPYCKTVIQY